MLHWLVRVAATEAVSTINHWKPELYILCSVLALPFHPDSIGCHKVGTLHTMFVLNCVAEQPACMCARLRDLK
jgi:hypothetical protein